MKTYETCEEVREEFSALLDGELAVDEQDGVEHHLAGCSECLRQLDGLKRVSDLYSDVPAVKVPTDFEINLDAEDPADNVVNLQSVRRESHPISFRPVLAAVAMLTMLAGVSYFASQQLKPSESMEMAAEMSATAGQLHATQGIAAEEADMAEEAFTAAAEPEATPTLADAPAEAVIQSFADVDEAEGRVEGDMRERRQEAPAPKSTNATQESAEDDRNAFDVAVAAPPPPAAAKPATGGANPPNIQEVVGAVGTTPKTLGELGFTRNAAGTWAEKGYTNQSLTAVTMESDAYRLTEQKRPELVPLLGIGGDVIYQIEGTWYRATDLPVTQ